MSEKLWSRAFSEHPQGSPATLPCKHTLHLHTNDFHLGPELLWHLPAQAPSGGLPTLTAFSSPTAATSETWCLLWGLRETPGYSRGSGGRLPGKSPFVTLKCKALTSFSGQWEGRVGRGIFLWVTTESHWSRSQRAGSTSELGFPALGGSSAWSMGLGDSLGHRTKSQIQFHKAMLMYLVFLMFYFCFCFLSTQWGCQLGCKLQEVSNSSQDLMLSLGESSAALHISALFFFSF